MPWYKFTPCCNDHADPKNRNQYSMCGNGSTPPYCEGYLRVCAIQATDWRGKPIINCELEEEIWCALEKKISTANVLLKGTDCDVC